MRLVCRHDINWSKLFHVVVKRRMWARLSDKAKAVYPVLHAYVDDNTRNCWPSNELLAQEAGLHEKTVPAATAELTAFKLIKKWRKDRKNFYHLYTEQELEDLVPSPMDVSLCPRKVDKRPFSRPRDTKGRFIRPPTLDGPIPHTMDTPSPHETALEIPPDLDTNKNPLRRNSEKELSNKNASAGSASALAGAKASPAAQQWPSPVRGARIGTICKLYHDFGFEGMKERLRDAGCQAGDIDRLTEHDVRRAVESSR